MIIVAISGLLANVLMVKILGGHGHSHRGHSHGAYDGIDEKVKDKIRNNVKNDNNGHGHSHGIDDNKEHGHIHEQKRISSDNISININNKE